MHRKTDFILVVLFVGSLFLTGVTFAKPGDTQRFNDRIEVAFQARYECLGEDIWVTGVMHVVTDTSQDADSLSISQHANSHFTGIGVTTGNQYVVNETNLYVQKYALNDLHELQVSGISQIWSFKAISQGSAPNFTIHLNLHWSWVNGVLKQDQYHVEPGC